MNVLSAKKFSKNYLRIYANIGKVKYSDVEKTALIKELISLTEQYCKQSKLKFDIRGVGYGISKGDSNIGSRAFNNRISKKGVKNLWGILVVAYKDDFTSSFSILSNKEQHLKRIELEFNWKYEGDESTKFALTLLENVSRFVTINYAYSYPAESSLSEFESKTRKSPFSISVFQPKAEILWNSSMHLIKVGKIKKLYPINVFSTLQKESLGATIKEMECIKVNDSLEIWTIAPQKAKKISPANSIL